MYQDNNVFSERKWGDPVRVKASFNSHSKRIDGHVVPEYRRFSVDPQLTNYEILRSLLERAFDIHSDFLIQYRQEDPSGQEVFLHLLSDWDLEAAFVSASDPYLCLRIDPIPLEQTVEEWDLINIPVGDYSIVKTKGMRSDPSLQIKFLTKVEKTISMMQQALNLNSSNGDEFAIGMSTSPLNDSEFTDFRDRVGTLINVEEFRQRIFHGGLEPSLRRVVWKHLLNVYPEGMNGSERMNYIRRKTDEYGQLKSKWTSHYRNKQMSEDLKNVVSMVRKDVLRTDRQHPFYGGGDDNPNVEELFNILTTYAMLHPSVGYCQGMSDMASPILFVMGSESHAYIAFSALMERLKDNFTTTGAAMTLKFEHLAAALNYHDQEFFSYLERHNASDLLFCYRWLLLEMKREFAFDDALRMLEVMWSSLPFKPRQGDLALYEIIPEFHSTTKPIPFARIKETPYSKVCAVRRQGSFAASGSPGSLPESPGYHLESSDSKHFHRSFSYGSPSMGNRRLDCLIRQDNVDTVQVNGTVALAVFDKRIVESKPTKTHVFQSDDDVFHEIEKEGESDGTLTPATESTTKSLVKISTSSDNEKQSKTQNELPAAAEKEQCSIQDFEVIASCEEAVEAIVATQKAQNQENQPTQHPSLPPPQEFGCGNPFLIFLCVTVLLQHRDYIINRSLDSNELAMHFDRLVRKHNLERVLSQARTLYYKYLGQFNKTSGPCNSSPKRNVGI